MKLLLDTCVWSGAKTTLQDAGHDVLWSGDWDRDPGDDEIMTLAHRELLDGAIVTVHSDRVRIRPSTKPGAVDFQ
jgi:predicted nuclease of predicted toxin-antitoxin system